MADSLLGSSSSGIVSKGILINKTIYLDSLPFPRLTNSTS